MGRTVTSPLFLTIRRSVITVTPARCQTGRIILGTTSVGVLQHVMGGFCAQNLAIRLQDDLEAQMDFQEDLSRLLFDGIACNLSAGGVATLCLVTANMYINHLSLRRLDPIFALPDECFPKSFCIAQS